MHQTWLTLCNRYLPVAPATSSWRYSRTPGPGDPVQGWKLHLPATVLNAAQVLERIAPVLTERGVQFKAPASLPELQRLNAGLQQGYSQVGKCFTVYPHTPAEALALAETLHQLTVGFSAPSVPFDQRLRAGSNVYYRYGAFRHLNLTAPDGVVLPALLAPDGQLVPDDRSAVSPAWVSNPFPAPDRVMAANDSPLKTTYRVCRALTQRGKGGVYLARDVSVQPARWCVLKEGRKNGEVSWDGRDGHWRIKHETSVLEQLRAAGLAAPCVYGAFELQGNYYLVTEFIAGENLQDMLNRRQRRLPLAQALRYGSELAALLAALHAAGWVWRDCKPANLILTDAGHLRPIDFEGACRLEQPDPVSWCTPAFAPDATQTAHPARSSVADDLYALGAVLHFLLWGRTPADATSGSLPHLHRGIPSAVRAMIEALLQAPPHQRPRAAVAARQLAATCLSLRPTTAAN
ncbi:MAG: protein kinase [Acidobacteria bacterium]|nr:protein kinase [Acidobacteriota bacterium]MBI3428298.1 protein kinase [Acidobacteriota bacterium]